jgi:Zn-dependent peptidase ImmA (M78 family)/transcriptional regulator with XRE-family HTH domain
VSDCTDTEVGARIQRLRDAAGLRGQDLAEKVNLDSTALSKIENGKRSVKSSELSRIASALKVSPLALLEDHPLLLKLPIAARLAGSSIVEGKAYQRLSSLAELHVLLANAGIPTSPDLSGVPNILGCGWLETANRLADWALTELPLQGVTGDQRLAVLANKIEAKLNVDILIDEFPNDALSGAAITDHTFPLLFVNSSHSRVRSLFTLAHELGHLLAGHRGEGVSLDRKELTGSTEHERIANAFAARFLLPESEITAALDEGGRHLSTLVNLANEHGVSYATLVYRLHNLRLIDAAVRNRLLSIGWEDLVRQSTPRLRSTGTAQNALGSLLARSQLMPAGRPPALLLRRVFDGFQKGIVSIRPLAGLMKKDPTELLNELPDVSEFSSISEEFSRVSSAIRDPAETDEILFSGNPV